MKKIMVFILMLTFVLSTLSSCSLIKSFMKDKWVLVCEDRMDDFDGDEISRTVYRYDEEGRLNYKKYIENIYDTTGSDAYLNCDYSDFKYDDNGNVISYTEESDGEYTYYTFVYDSNGNCLSYTGKKERVDYIKLYNYTAEYNENQNMVSEKLVYKYNGVTEGYQEKEYTLHYENDICVCAEVIEAYDIGWLETERFFEKYFYDENGNRIRKELYYLTEGDYDTEFNGRYYCIEEITTYTWEKLEDNTNKNNETVKEKYAFNESETLNLTNANQSLTDVNQQNHTHIFADATCTLPQKCKICGITEGVALGHAFFDATCTEPQICSRCGEKSGEALGHKYNKNVCINCQKTDPESLPVGLNELFLIDSYEYEYKPGAFTDSYGNKYNGSHYYMDLFESGNGVEPHSLFNLEGNFKTFTGSIVASTETDPEWSYYINIYVDGVLKYTKTGITKTSKKADFEIDVSNADTLEIRAGLEGNTGDWNQEICIVDAELSK